MLKSQQFPVCDLCFDGRKLCNHRKSLPASQGGAQPNSSLAMRKNVPGDSPGCCLRTGDGKDGVSRIQEVKHCWLKINQSILCSPPIFLKHSLHFYWKMYLSYFRSFWFSNVNLEVFLQVTRIQTLVFPWGFRVIAPTIPVPWALPQSLCRQAFLRLKK